MKKNILVLVGSLFFVASSFATDASNFTQSGSAQQKQKANLWNHTHHVHRAPLNVLRPFSEVETTGYVAMSGGDFYELSDIRKVVAQNLPSGVDLIIYVDDPSETSAVQNAIGQYLGDRLKFLSVDLPDIESDPYWARDSLPFPVYLKTSVASGTFGLVASIYPQDFDPNQVVATALGLPMSNTNEYFRGGNLLFDLDGNCFSELANEVASLSDPQGFFTDNFGCKTITLLDKQQGLGDIDERLKFLTGKDVLTDNDDYAGVLSGKGYTIHRIPQTGDDSETYMNTLFVNGTFFVPQMGIPADQDALNAYKALGFKAFGIYTKDLADDADGNIHCTTMNYPPGTFTPNKTDPRFVEFAR